MKFKFTTLLILALFAFSSTSFAQHEKKPNVNTETGIGDALPDFNFELPDGTWLNQGVLTENQPVIVFYFDPTCEHCQKEAGWVRDQPESFEGITMIWVSWAEKVEDNVNFYKEYFMGVQSKVYIARDSNYKIDDYFGYSEVPSTYVYNAGWKRTASFNAETEPEILVKFAKMKN